MNLLNIQINPIIKIIMLGSMISIKAYANLDAQKIADSMQSTINSTFKNVETHELKDLVSYKGTDIKESNMSLTEAEGAGTQARESGNLKEISSNRATLKRNEQIAEYGFTKDKNFMSNNNQGYLDQALRQVKNSKNEFDYLKGEYAECNPSEDYTTSNTIGVCDQYHSNHIRSCFPEQIVEIDAKYNYLCNKTRETRTKICLDEIVSLKCRESKECDMGGIKPGSIESDMKLEYANGILTIGTIASNYWTGHCTVYDRKIKFTLKNIKKIKDFTLTEVGFDDHMQLSLNGHIIYVGPDGGSHLEVVEREYKWGRLQYRTAIVYNGIQDYPCERNTDWHQYPNKDLIPFLVEGENIIEMKVVVERLGEGWLRIRAKQNCCNEWDIKRETKCIYS